MASQEVFNAMQPLVYERDRHEFALGDTLDVKTGLIVVALTFLAVQSGHLIYSGLPVCQKIIQYISVISLTLGGIAAALELRPVEYDREATPDKYQSWLEKEVQKIDGNEEHVATMLAKGRFDRAMERVNNNLTINKRKSRFMNACFLFALVAFIANGVTLFIRLLS